MKIHKDIKLRKVIKNLKNHITLIKFPSLGFGIEGHCRYPTNPYQPCLNKFDWGLRSQKCYPFSSQLYSCPYFPQPHFVQVLPVIPSISPCSRHNKIYLKQGNKSHMLFFCFRWLIAFDWLWIFILFIYKFCILK